MIGPFGPIRLPVPHPVKLRSPHFLNRFNLFLFSRIGGQKTSFVFSESVLYSAIPTQNEGRTRRHEREAGCGGRGRCRATSDADADGEVVWFWRPKAGVKLAG